MLIDRFSLQGFLPGVVADPKVVIYNVLSGNILEGFETTGRSLSWEEFTLTKPIQLGMIVGLGHNYCCCIGQVDVDTQ